jgi:hypothetical protein
MKGGWCPIVGAELGKYEHDDEIFLIREERHDAKGAVFILFTIKVCRS